MPAAPRSATETGSGTSRRWPKTLRYSMRRPFQPSAVRPTPAAAPMIPSSVPPCPLRRAPAAAARASACVTTSTAARLPKATSAGIARQPSHAMHSPGSLPSIQFACRCLTARSVSTPSSSREGARHPVKGPSPATATRRGQRRVDHVDDADRGAVVRGERHVRMNQQLLPDHRPEAAAIRQFVLEPAADLAGAAVGVDGVGVVEGDVQSHVSRWRVSQESSRLVICPAAGTARSAPAACDRIR